MGEHAFNSGSALRSRPNATYSSAAISTNNSNNSYTDSYAGAMHGTPEENSDSFFRCSWLRCCGIFRQSGSTGNESGGMCGCYIKDESRPKWLSRFYGFTKSAVWLFFLYCFSIFLLFGPAIQCLADSDTTGDAVFLCLRLVMLCFFTVDIMIRCVAEEDYFVITLCRRSKSSVNASARSNTTSGDSKERKFSFGSFLFWCDFISTLSILYDLSFISNHRFDPIDVEITVVEGIPNRELTSRLAPHSLELNLLMVILRTARCARFVQSHFAVDTSNRFSLYGIRNHLRLLIPCSYLNLWDSKHETQKRRLSQTKDDAEKMTMAGESIATDKRLKSKKRLVSSVLTTIHTEAKNKTREEGRVKSQFGEALLQKVKSSLPISNKEVLVSKHEAAIKIQRIWRSRTLFESDDEWEVPPFLNQSSPSIRLKKSIRMKSILTSFSKRSVSQEDANNTAPKSILDTFTEKHTDMVELKDDVAPKSILDSFAENNPDMERPHDIAPKSRYQSRAGKTHDESQVGSDMRQLTGKRVAMGTLLTLICTLLCTYTESTTTQIKTMVVLHTQTQTSDYINRSLRAAISSSVPTLYEYHPVVNAKTYFNPNINGTELTKRNKLNISITDFNNETSFGLFDNSKSIKHEATVDIIATIFIILFWFAGVVSFSAPVAMLVITPVEQMVRLLGMLTRDPLGYQSTPVFKQFLRDEDAMSAYTGWSKEILKGMETSFLKSTILRIGSLMKIGFGSAGVQIIQSNLKTGQNQNMLTLNTQGTPVSCIFLFCDIRQFTDATEQLQEEVFVFTNRIAAVVHSICNSYSGAANKNVGDAFLVSWSLDEKGRSGENGPLKAKNNQADKALLSVIRICISLAYDNFFLEPLSGAAIGRLKTKLQDRPGSVVQMGFGLHVGRAFQGAIGSQRKIDAAYVAESAERAEFLESSTKKYGLKLLMSGDFLKLLHKRTRDRCRKIDQLLMPGRGDEYFEELEFMDIFTYDMDVDALQRPYSSPSTTNDGEINDLPNTGMEGRKRKQNMRKRRKGHLQNPNAIIRVVTGGNTVDRSKKSESDLISRGRLSSTSFPDIVDDHDSNGDNKPTELVLPKGPVLFSQNVWLSPDMKRIRQKYVQEKWFFEKFKLGLKAFYKKEWIDAKNYFRDILGHFDDGPSKYFLAQIDKNNGIPPQEFRGYGIVN